MRVPSNERMNHAFEINQKTTTSTQIPKKIEIKGNICDHWWGHRSCYPQHYVCTTLSLTSVGDLYCKQYHSFTVHMFIEENSKWKAKRTMNGEAKECQREIETSYVNCLNLTIRILCTVGLHTDILLNICIDYDHTK